MKNIKDIQCQNPNISYHWGEKVLKVWPRRWMDYWKVVTWAKGAKGVTEGVIRKLSWGKKVLKVWPKNGRWYWNVKLKNTNNASSDMPCHIAKTRCHNQNKECYVKPHSYAKSRKIRTHQSCAQKTKLELKMSGNPRAKENKASIGKPTY